GFFIRHWSKPLRECLEFMHKGYKLGLEIGDFVYCGHCINEFSMLPLQYGSNLDDVLANHARFKDFQESVKDPFVANQYHLLNQFCLNLKGLTDSPFSLNSPGFDHEERVAAMRAQGNPLNVFFYLLVKEKIRYLYGDYAEACRVGAEIDPLLQYPKGSFYLAEHIFYRCLSLLAVFPDRASSERRDILKRVKGYQKQMKRWGESCPANYLHKYLLIAAEACAVTDRHLEAADLYRQAIQSAREHGYTNNEALANERTALFYQGKGYEEIADVYLKEAYQAYQKWGATAKLRELERSHAYFTQRSAKARTGHALHTHTQTAATTIGSSGTSTLLDLGTVMKASQTISSEIMLDRLLGSIMQIAVTHAGARKAFFILDTEGTLTLEAVRKEGAEEEIQVLRATPLADRDDLSPAIVHYVHRSGETVILGDATQEGIFKNEAYILRDKCKSILAMPIIHKGKSSGILYMENNLIPQAFTPERLELLRLISAQAAISIENALLFEQATTDGLTKLFVHRYFQFLLDQEISRSRRHKKSFSLIMMDIDDFKRLNDTYGHPVGDEVLRGVAKTIKQNLRAEDSVARYGGEEFVVILPETDTKGALTVAEKPLYASKHAGKNRVSVGGKIK
ncbi:MAG: diguanylate cyclase, partial [Desulfobacterales bacterium]|nr:diguanylate cyclase [Desulfobacterales bacterium]